MTQLSSRWVRSPAVNKIGKEFVPGICRCADHPLGNMGPHGLTDNVPQQSQAISSIRSIHFLSYKLSPLGKRATNLRRCARIMASRADARGLNICFYCAVRRCLIPSPIVYGYRLLVLCASEED